MGKPPVSRAALHALIALRETKAHDQNIDDEVVLKFPGPSAHLADDQLHQWLRSATAGTIFLPPAHEIAEGGAPYDHASDFLHRLLRKMDRKVH